MKIRHRGHSRAHELMFPLNLFVLSATGEVTDRTGYTCETLLNHDRPASHSKNIMAQTDHQTCINHACNATQAGPGTSNRHCILRAFIPASASSQRHDCNNPTQSRPIQYEHPAAPCSSSLSVHCAYRPVLEKACTLPNDGT